MQKRVWLIIVMIVLLVATMALAVACDNKDKDSIDDGGSGIIDDGGNNGGDNNGGSNGGDNTGDVDSGNGGDNNGGNNGGDNTGDNDSGNGGVNNDGNNGGDVVDEESKVVDLSQYLLYQVIGDTYTVQGLRADIKEAVSGEDSIDNVSIDEAIIIIPSTYDGKQVTSIEAKAFSGCIGLKTITIPDSVTSIGEGAFSGCKNLESMTIPFVGAKSGVIGSDKYQYPFGYIFGKSKYIGGVATTQYYYGSSFSATNSTYYIPSSLKTVTVTGGNILYGAFYNCGMLTSITIPDRVTKIGGSAFYGCTGLKSIILPNSTTSIGKTAFSNCSSLTDITISSNVSSIGDNAFVDCDSLTKVSISNIAKWCTIRFGIGYANPLCNGINLYLNGELVSDLLIPEGVTSIGSNAFV